MRLIRFCVLCSPLRRAVRIKGHFMHHGHQCLVFELLSHNLFDLIVLTNFQGMSLRTVATIAKQLLRTLGFLSMPKHGSPAQRVIHCDLKPENVLLRYPNRTAIKVIDFGSACFSAHKPYTYIQSRFYRAPELLLGRPYDTAIE